MCVQQAPTPGCRAPSHFLGRISAPRGQGKVNKLAWSPPLSHSALGNHVEIIVTLLTEGRLSKARFRINWPTNRRSGQGDPGRARV
jgi:hypothetical protein